MLPFQTGSIKCDSGTKRRETKPWDVPPKPDKSTLGPRLKKIKKFIFVTIQLLLRHIQLLRENVRLLLTFTNGFIADHTDSCFLF